MVSRDKRLSNGHGGDTHAITCAHTHTHTPTLIIESPVLPSEWEERGKGRGRGKHVPGSSSVSQVAAVSSSGRVQKQHSWTPQASVEEQGGVKHSK